MPNVKPELKGLLWVPDGMPIPFLYNPEEIPETRSVEYVKKNPLGFSHPVSHYMYGKDVEFSFEMSIRSRTDVFGKVLTFPLELYIQALLDLTYPIRKGGIMVSAPPTVTLIFGTLWRDVRISSVEIIRKEFSPLLLCKWARVRLSLFEVVTKNKNRRNSTASGLSVLKSLGGILGGTA